MRDAAVQQDGRAGGPWSRLVRVLTSPGKAMAEVAEDPAVLAPYLTWMLVSTAVMLLVFLLKREEFVAAAIRQLEDRFAAMGVPEEQLEVAKASVPANLMVGALAGGLISPWLGGLYYALVMLLFGNFTGQAGKFKQYLSVAGYAAMPVVVGSVLRVPLMMAATSQEAALQAGYHLGGLVPGASGALAGFLMTFDLFGIWSLILVVLGYAAIHRMPPARAAWVGVFFFVVRALGAAGSMALSTSLMGLGG
ncbi:MAG: Yip1 family protein [Bacillota bacterium]